MVMIVALAPMTMSAQIDETEFLKTAQSMQEGYQKLLWSGKPKEAIASLEKYIQFLDTTTVINSGHITEAVLKSEISNLKYDLACCLALSGQKKKALAALSESIDGGFSQYEHMLEDNDLASLRNEKKFKELAEIVAERSPFTKLKRSNKYEKEATNPLPAFEYQPKEAPNLKMVRDYFQLDTIPGKGNELEHIKNILHFAHDNIRHNGSNRAVCEFTSIDIYNYNKATDKGVNCRQLAISLCDMYLALGYKARVVTCLPADPNDFECHVINAVWSETLHKWLYIDPTMDAWVMDENGVMLSIAEVRERLIDGRELVLCEGANWNHENTQTKEHYLYQYMAKNLYYFVCKKRSFFNQESLYRKIDNEDLRLIPAGFVNDNFGVAKTTTDPEWFWAEPK